MNTTFDTRRGRVPPEGAVLSSVEREVLLAEEVPDRDVAQFGADDAVAALREPGHVEALAAERHVHAAARRDLESRPELLEERMNDGLVEADLSGLPALVPELGVHGVAV